MPRITQGDFDWIGYYGNIAETGQSYSETTTSEDPGEQLSGLTPKALYSPMKDKQGGVIGAVEYGIDVTQL